LKSGIFLLDFVFAYTFFVYTFLYIICNTNLLFYQYYIMEFLQQYHMKTKAIQEL